MSPAMRKRLAKDPFMQQCCICGASNPQWHHNFEYARKAVNEDWCILPLCPKHHEHVRQIGYRRLLDWAMLSRASHEDLDKYKRVMDYHGKLSFLTRTFGEFTPELMRRHYRENFNQCQIQVRTMS
jgi:hypothetical protein